MTTKPKTHYLCSYSDGETRELLVPEEAAKALCDPKHCSLHSYLIILIAILQGKCVSKCAHSKVCVLKTHHIYGRYADLPWQKYFGGMSSSYKETDLIRFETDNLTTSKSNSVQDAY